MKLKFDSTQQFQLSAIKSTIDLFEGQPLKRGDFEINFDEGSLKFDYTGIGNNLIINKEQILKNLNNIQSYNNISRSDTIDTLNFSVEMETGTGKTYVYLRTIYELNKVYGFKKFVIVVPSIAIREGVIKNLRITSEHFKDLYSNPPLNYNIFDPKKKSILKNFAINNAIQILVINIDSFSKDINLINREGEDGIKPIEYLQSTNPFVIMDEPQNMETELRSKAINNLNPLCTLRYSATHRNHYNLIYKIDPIQAYDLGLVKQIEVDGIDSDKDPNSAFIKFEKLNRTKTKISAVLKIFINDLTSIKQKTIKVSIGDDLYNLSNKREIYKTGFIINSIDANENIIEFANGIILKKGDSQGVLNEEIIKYQIQRTVEIHLKKEKKYKNLGIKVLSLFFIDKVSNYRVYDSEGIASKGKYALWFEEIYKKTVQKDNFKELDIYKTDELHNGYFSQDRGKIKDTSGNTVADKDTYSLIMKNKERLLDQNEPLRFIFTHSALREGWDNPNVFQICTLNETHSDLKKRQELGRGLRLPVNHYGERVFDKNINLLSVIANQTYADFSNQLQKEIEDDYDINFENRIKNARQKKQIKLTKNLENCKEFLEIWNIIKTKSSYQVKYSTDDLIKKSILKINEMPAVSSPLLTSETYKVNYSKKGIEGNLTNTRRKKIDKKNYTIPDVFTYIQNKINITRETIYQILTKSNRLNELEINPQMFLDNIVNNINNVLNELMVDGIKYEKINNEEYKMKLFKDEEIETYLSNLFQVTDKKKTLYDYINFDSGIECEFAKDCELDESVKFYFKLPKRFKIPTPLGNYVPDWAVVFENDNKIYFIIETKSSLDSNLIRNIEELKIKCGVKHFAEFKDIEYRKITNIKDLY